MKKFFIVGILSVVLIFLLASCGDKTEGDDNDLVYGQIENIDETTVTIELGSYKTKEKFKGSGQNATYNLPETVFYDYFEQGDIVAILFDGEDATMIADVKEALGDFEGVLEETDQSYFTAAKVFDGMKSVLNSNVYTASTEGENALLAKNESVLTIEGGMINKSGDSTDLEASHAYGLNAAMLITSGAQVNVNDVTVTSSSEGADGIFVSGSKSRAVLDNGLVKAAEDFSRGIAAAYGGTIDADAINVITSGEDSPCIYSAANISLTNSTATAEQSSVAAVEGDNNISVRNCKLTGASDEGAIVYHDERQGTASTPAKCIVRNSEITNNAAGAMFYVDGINAAAAVTDTELVFGSGILADVVGDSDSDGSSDSGKFILKGLAQKFSGEIKCDSRSKIKLILMEKSSFTGVIDKDNTALYSKIYLSKDSVWNVTADSFVGSIANEKKTCANIKSNGHNIYYNADNSANQWLGGESIDLQGGGRLLPTK